MSTALVTFSWLGYSTQHPLLKGEDAYLLQFGPLVHLLQGTNGVVEGSGGRRSSGHGGRERERGARAGDTPFRVTPQRHRSSA